jgi:hypothetical protein
MGLLGAANAHAREKPHEELTVVCTDRGQHATTQIARFAWTPGSMDDVGFAVWDSGAGDTLDTITEGTRGTNAGGTRHIKRKPTRMETRSDGGQTFHLPRCPRCGREFRLREDRIIALRHYAPTASPDLSLVM